MPGTHHEFEATRGNLFHQAPPDSGSGKWATEKTFGYTMAVVLIGLQGLWWTEWYQYNFLKMLLIPNTGRTG